MKHYRLKKDTFLWKAGAILQHDPASTNDTLRLGYRPVEDIWDAVPVLGGEYISARIIEHPDNAEYFERVYPDTLKGKLFHTKDQLVELYTNAFK